MNFESFNLHPQIFAGVRAQSYTTPTPIQVQTIPPGLEGRDILGLAQTGTGKTAAFVLPILQRLMNGPRGRIRALIVAPTRELAEQIHETIVMLGKKTGLRSVTVYGGVGIVPQIRALRGQTEIVIACPGRLLDHIGQGTIDLKAIEVLVLDEADRMFDMGFLPDVRRILRHLPAQRQTMLFSATMPEDIRQLAGEVLNDPVTAEINFEGPPKTVSHALYPVQSARKTDMLMQLLKQTDTESVLIFTRTKHRAKKLADHLHAAGYKSVALQGNMAQNARQAAMNGFRNGIYKIMVATDIAARGIDVSQISHVINYDIPDTADAYTHRIGRTGRAAKTGDAYTLVSQEDAEMVREIERALGTKIERRTVAGFEAISVEMPTSNFNRRPTSRNSSQPSRQQSQRPSSQRGGYQSNYKPAHSPQQPVAAKAESQPAQQAAPRPVAQEKTQPNGSYFTAARKLRQAQRARRRPGSDA
ncbi:MAG: DEAD/DEAH box helicase [Chloroflexi bacterium]|nr:DEAD/DEAH box helicase [Chloroflexota bacterium]